MGLFHRHQWEEVARAHVPPVSAITSRTITVKHAPVGSCERMVHGSTSVELRCCVCGVRKAVQFVGHIGRPFGGPS